MVNVHKKKKKNSGKWKPRCIGPSEEATPAMKFHPPGFVPWQAGVSGECAIVSSPPSKAATNPSQPKDTTSSGTDKEIRSRPRVAVLLRGGAHMQYSPARDINKKVVVSWRGSACEIMEKLVIPLRADVFLHGWVDDIDAGMSTDEEVKSITDFYRPKGFRLEAQKDFSRAYKSLVTVQDCPGT